MTTAERGTQGTVTRFFAEPLRDYVVHCPEKPVSLLQAGCLASPRELGTGQLAEDGSEILVTAVDADTPLARRALADAGTGYDDVLIGDPRTVPADARPGHRRATRRGDPTGPPGTTIIVGAYHLRRHLPANPGALQRRPR